MRTTQKQTVQAEKAVRRTPKKVKMPKMGKDSKATPIFKAVLLGPIIVSFIIAIFYLAWWGLAKLFYLLHGWMTTSVLSWVEGAWPYVLGIWAFVLITSVAYTLLAEKKKFTEKASLENGSDAIQADAFEDGSEMFKPTFNGEDIFSDSKTK